MLAQIKYLLVAARQCWVERIYNGTNLCEFQQLRLTLFRVIGNLLDHVEGKDTKDPREGEKEGEGLIEMVPV